MKAYEKNTGQKRDTILAAVPNDWIWLPVLEILSASWEQLRVKRLSDLYDQASRWEGILLVDIFTYREPYRKIIGRLHELNANLPIVFLLSEKDIRYRSYFEEKELHTVVIKEQAVQALLPALSAARLQLLRTRATPVLVSQKEVKTMEHRDENFLNKKFNRRTFLKGSAAAAAVTGLTLSDPGNVVVKALTETNEPASSEEKIYVGNCRSACQNGCMFNITVRDGKIVKTFPRPFPEEEYTRICLKGITSPYRVYNPHRLKYPMKRVGERGAGEWQQISWEEAIKEVTDKWKGYQQQYGNSSVGIYVGGAANIGVCSGGGYATNAVQRLVNTFGAAHIAGSYDAAAGQGKAPVQGYAISMSANEPLDMALHSNTIFIWGTNPANNQMQTMHFILEARDRGAKVVVIDTIFTSTASRADVYVQPRPGTDGLLAYAMMNIALKNDWVDWDYVKTKTDMPYWIKEDHTYLKLSDIRAVAEGETDGPVVKDSTGAFVLPSALKGEPVLNGTETVNGHTATTVYDLVVDSIKEFTPEYAAENCDVPLEQIEEITALYTQNKPSCIFSIFGLNNYVNAHYNYRAIDLLAAFTGNMNKPGSFSGNFQNLGSHILNYGILMPQGGIPSSIKIPFIRLKQVLDTKKYGDTDVEIKSLFIGNGNPVSNSAQKSNTLELISKVEFVVVCDINMTDTARYADIILPASYWFEQEDIAINSFYHPFMLHQEKAIDPLYETKPDFEIFKLLAEGMGYPDAFAYGPEGLMRDILNTDGARGLGVTLENLREHHAVRVLPFKPFYIENPATPIGKIQFYNVAPAPSDNFGQEWDPDKERLPYWEPPHEAWHKNELFKKYPFYMVDEKARNRVHSQWWEVKALEEVYAEPFVAIHSQDAEPLGIKSGDIVRVYNDRGQMVVKARIHNGLKPGVLSTPRTWEKHQYIDGSFQELTSAVSSPMVSNYAFSDKLVNIEKVN